jgi:hypothetical protein
VPLYYTTTEVGSREYACAVAAGITLFGTINGYGSAAETQILSVIVELKLGRDVIGRDDWSLA